MAIIKPPSWIIPGAFADLDFSNNRYWGGNVSVAGAENKQDLCTDNGSYASSIPYTPQKNGILLAGLSNQNRITNLGLWAERGATNNALWSRDLTASGGTSPWQSSLSCTVANNQVGNDTTSIAGAISSASSITALTPSAQLLQAITLSSRVVIFSAYVKRLSGTGIVKITSDGITWTDVTSQLNTVGYTLVQNLQQTLSSVSCGFQLGTAADSIAVDFCQLETSNTSQMANILPNQKATTPLVTTTTTVSRANNTSYWQNTNSVGTTSNDGQRILNDVFSYGGPWTMIASFNGNFIDNSVNAGVRGPIFIASDMTFPGSITCGGGTVGFGNSFANKTSNVCNVGLGNWNIAAVSSNLQGSTVCLNGGAPSAISTGALTTPIVYPNGGFSHFNIFNNGAGTSGSQLGGPPLEGSCGRVAFLKAQLTNGQLTEWTSLTGLFATF